jgi:hypothetical protein
LRTVTTVVAPDQSTLTTYLDQLASAEYLAGRAGQPGPAQAGQPTAYGELWLLALALTGTTPNLWSVYALTSADDVPGWPYATASYTGGIRGPADVAQALQTGGATVTLRHYAAFAVTTTADTITLT